MSPAFIPPTPSERPELFFALIGATGTDLELVTQALRAELGIVGYAVAEPVRLSRLLEALHPYESLGATAGPEDVRIAAYMDAGDAVRHGLSHGSALAALAVAHIRRQRDASEAKPSTAFVLRSLKHPKEVELLRTIYGASLVVISVYEPEEAREQHLELRIRRSGGDTAQARDRARQLIVRDQDGGADPEFGQNVRKTFPLADFFLDAGGDLRKQVARLVHLLFEHPGMSPTRDEYAMFMAQAVALRSADMSRQVGAVLVDAEGEVVAAGCNEVPKPGGGVYWSGDEPDLRDFKLGSDPNALMGRELLGEVFGQLKRAGWLGPDVAALEPAALVEQARTKGLFEAARVGNLIEFGRVVHAEMNALMHAARHGIRVDGHRLYCTTFPCHGCARHIIGAGIAEVIYIEPYPKSLAVALYPGAISLGPSSQAVVFRSFTGVAPRRYLELFGFGRRKDTRGYAVEWAPLAARPRARQLGNPHLYAERVLCDTLLKVLKDRSWS